MAQKLREPKFPRIIHKIREFFRKPEPDNSAMLQERLNASLLEAAANGRADEVETLLKDGAEVWRTNDSGVTALMLAASGGYTRICGMLLEHGASINSSTLDGSTPLMLAARGGKAQACAFLIEKGAAVNAVNEDSSNGWTALHWAAINGHTKTCAVLVAKGANINLVNELYYTPGILAEQHKKTETAAFLRSVKGMWGLAGGTEFVSFLSFFNSCFTAA